MVLTISKQLPGVAYYLPKNLQESSAEENPYENMSSLLSSSVPAPTATKLTAEMPRQENYGYGAKKDDTQAREAQMVEMSIRARVAESENKRRTIVTMRPALDRFPPPFDGLCRKLIVAIDFGTTFSGVSYRSITLRSQESLEPDVNLHSSILQPGVVPEILGVNRYFILVCTI